jgi:putative transposase
VSRSNLISRVKYEDSKRSNRYQKSEDGKYLCLIKEVLKERPSYGYRRVHPLLNSKLASLGQKKVNCKRVYRLMKDANLLLIKPQKRAKRAHTGKVETFASNIRWCTDNFSIQCWNGDQVHISFSLDCCDREIMRYIASTKGIDGQAIRDLMLETVEYRFGEPKAPKVQWLSDNGSCYIARETVQFGRQIGLDIRTTPVRSPESNGIAESFVKTFKRDYVIFGDLKDAQTVMAQLPKWFEDYNCKAPHKALKMLSPREFMKTLKQVV